MSENKRASKRSKRSTAEPKSGRLSPGELDKLVLGYMRRHKKAAPHTSGAVAKGIKRSSGAVANCLSRQGKKGTVRLAKPKPREYDLTKSKKS
jgi:class 3 adenylate cyclase